MRSIRWFGSVVLLVATALAPLLVTARPAAACSCVPWSARDAVAHGDAVIVGRAVERDDATGDFGPEWEWTVEVDEVLAGSVEPVVAVRTDSGATTCGPVELSATAQGVVLWRDPDGNWATGSCGGLWPPDVLRVAAGPWPPAVPTRAEALVVTHWGPVRFLGLDSTGAVVGYGVGETTVSALTVCPGGARLAEAHTVPAGEVSVRDLHTFAMVAGTSGAGGGASSSVAAGLACRDGEGTAVEVLVRDDATDVPLWRLLRDGGATIDLGAAAVMALDPERSSVVAASGTVLTAWDGASGRWRPLAHLDGDTPIVGLAVGPDGAVASVRGRQDRWLRTVDEVVLVASDGTVGSTAVIEGDHWLDAVAWPGDGHAALLIRNAPEQSTSAELVSVGLDGTVERIPLPGPGSSAVATSAGYLVTTSVGLVHLDPAGAPTVVGPIGEEVWGLTAVRPPATIDAPAPPPRPAELLAVIGGGPPGDASDTPQNRGPAPPESLTIVPDADREGSAAFWLPAAACLVVLAGGAIVARWSCRHS